ncbi:MAG: hypothetical protein ABJN69_13995 [Hellea sp.]
MWLRFLIMAAALFGTAITASAHDQNYELEGDYLYRVTTLRAEAGSFEELLNWFSDIKTSDYFKDSGDHAPFIMRHSQGDQWDLILILPMESWEVFYSGEASKKRKAIGKGYADRFTQGLSKVAFAEELYAYGPDLKDFKTAYNENGLYHIEMFHAAAGKTAELYKQRQMENEYLSSTGQIANMIFRRAGGSDVDVFTIGFHKDFKSFTADAPATPAEKEQAAKDAGFKDRADLSFYLRSLLNGHHDTFATKVD